MATQDSTNVAQPKRSHAEMLLEEITERDNRVYALVQAIRMQLPNDLNPQYSSITTTTAHLLGILDDMLEDHSGFIELERLLAEAREVAA